MKVALPELYNYYPQTAISLCCTSYLDVSYIPAQCLAMGLEVVWGPARLLSFFDIPYSCMFIAKNATTGEYWVVVRGTDPVSLTSWVSEDFSVGATEPVQSFAPHAPADARVSQGTFNALRDLRSLTDPNTGETAASFIQRNRADIPFLYVTGHSLGATVVPPTFAAIANDLYGGETPENMAMWSFAGLTSGNAAFAGYIDSLTQNSFPWRFHNPLDVAPLLYGAPDQLRHLYDANGLDWYSLDFILRGLLDDIMQRAEGKGYTQPGGEYVLAQSFNPAFDGWSAQASYQHHCTTYQQLVYAQFPVKFPLGS